MGSKPAFQGAGPKTFEGRTSDVDAPFVSGDFWEVGKIVRGKVTRPFTSNIEGKTSLAYEIELEDPILLDGEEWERVSVGNLAGFRMALTACGTDRLYKDDQIEIECESIKKPKKEGYSPRPNFRLKIVRS